MVTKNFNNISLIKTLNSKNIIQVTSSSDHFFNSVDIKHLIDLNESTWWASGDEFNQSFTLFFRRSFVVPLNYTISTVYYDHSPFEWIVFGSVDNENWIQIGYEKENICENNYVLRTDNVIVCSKVISKTYPIHVVMPFSYIKIQQIGYNSGRYENDIQNSVGSTKAFYLSGVEIYGDLLSSIFNARSIAQIPFEKHAFLFLFTLFSK